MKHTVLLVEDDRAISTVISEALQDEGLAVTACSSIAHRDELIAKKQFDVMLTDIMLDDGDGLETISDVHNAAPNRLWPTGGRTVPE